MTSRNDDVAGMVAALAVTLDQHFPGFLQDFEQNAGRVFDFMGDSESIGDGKALSTAGYLARLVLDEDLKSGRRRGER